MNEMKVWMTPEVEVQNFQANEYVSVCVVGPADGNLVTEIFTGSNGGSFIKYYVKDTNGNRVDIDRDKIKSGQFEIAEDSDHNSGTLYTDNIYWTSSLELGEHPSRLTSSIFIDNDGNIYLGNFTKKTYDDNGNQLWS